MRTINYLDLVRLICICYLYCHPAVRRVRLREEGGGETKGEGQRDEGTWPARRREVARKTKGVVSEKQGDGR